MEGSNGFPFFEEYVNENKDRILQVIGSMEDLMKVVDSDGATFQQWASKVLDDRNGGDPVGYSFRSVMSLDIIGSKGIVECKIEDVDFGGVDEWDIRFEDIFKPQRHRDIQYFEGAKL